MRFQCPECHEIVSVDHAEAGSNVQCGHCQKVVQVPASRTAPGAVIADFIIIRELGRGGMGIVYLSHQISLDRSAALKVLAESYANNTEFVVGFIKEARAAAKLNHPHIVQAYAVGEDEGLYYFAMENVDGKTMKEVLAEKKIIPIEEATQIIQQIAEALDYAWKEQRLVHRDIKPDNIMLTNNGKAKLADLGLARVAGDKDEKEDSDEVMGTPQYISPEALLGEPMDIRSDIYSLGATFYQFVTGQFPFNGNSASEIAKKHITDPLVPPVKVNPSVPQNISDVIVKMMEKDPNKRYQDGETLVEELRNIRKSRAVSGKVPRLKIPTTSSVSLQKLAGLTPEETAAKTPVLKMPGASAPSPAAASSPAPASASPSAPSVPNGPAPALKMPSKPKPPEPPKEETPVSTETKNGGLGKNKDSKVSKQVKKMKEQREKQATKKVVGSAVLAVVLLAAIGIGAWVAFGDGKEKLTGMFSRVHQKVAKTVEVAQEPASTPLTMKADEIIAFAGNGTASPEAVVEKCEDFFQNFKEAQYTKEREKYAEIERIFNEYDEKLCAPQRQVARDQYLAKLEEEKEAERRRAEEAARQARERKEREEREREQRRLAEIQRKKDAQELNALRNQIRSGTPRARIEMIEKFSNNDYAGAKKVLEDVIAVQKQGNGKPQPYRNEANRYANWGRKMLNWLNQAESFRNLLRNGGAELKRPQLVYKGKFGAVVSIKNGVVTADEGGGKTFTVNLKELSRSQFNAFILRVANRINRKQAAFLYFMMKGDFEVAEEYAKDLAASGDQKKELNDTAIEYIRAKYRSANAEQKKQLEKKYGKLGVFKKAVGRR